MPLVQNTGVLEGWPVEELPICPLEFNLTKRFGYGIIPEIKRCLISETIAPSSPAASSAILFHERSLVVNGPYFFTGWGFRVSCPKLYAPASPRAGAIALSVDGEVCITAEQYPTSLL